MEVHGKHIPGWFDVEESWENTLILNYVQKILKSLPSGTAEKKTTVLVPMGKEVTCRGLLKCALSLVGLDKEGKLRENEIASQFNSQSRQWIKKARKEGWRQCSLVSKLKKEFQVVLRLAVALEVPARSTVREDNGVGRDSTQPLRLVGFWDGAGVGNVLGSAGQQGAEQRLKERMCWEGHSGHCKCLSTGPSASVNPLQSSLWNKYVSTPSC